MFAWVLKLGRRVLCYLRKFLSLGDAYLQGQGEDEKAREEKEKGEAEEAGAG